MLPAGSRKEEAAESLWLLAWKYVLTHIFLLIEMPPFGGRKEEAAESLRLLAWKYALTHIFLLNLMLPAGSRKEVEWKKRFIRR